MAGPDVSTDVSIVVLSWNTADLLRSCLRSLLAEAPRRSREIIVVDNASSDGSAEMVRREFPAVVLFASPENLLYAEGNNRGAREARGRYLCFLNSDTEVSPGAIDTLVDFLEARPEYGIAAPKLLNSDGSVQRSCSRFPRLLDALLDSSWLGRLPLGRWWTDRTGMSGFSHSESRDVDQAMGACLVCRRHEFLELGGFDRRFSLYFNDHDLCKRFALRGQRTRFVADKVVLHHRGESIALSDTAKLIWARNRIAYYRKHHGTLGSWFLRLVTRLWAVEVCARILLSPNKDREAKKEAATQTLRFARKVLAP